VTKANNISADRQKNIDKNQNPIAIFDSGVGGLSIAKCIAEQLPSEHLIYFADSLHAPYGDKPAEFIQQRVNHIAAQLIQQNAKALVIACNTATVNAIDQLRKRIDIPVIGVEPAIKPASQQTKTGKVGILVTSATAKNQRFISLVNRFTSDIEVYIQPCPGLMNVVEQGMINSEHSKQLLLKYINPLLAKQVDTLVLGCTHYPFLTGQIREIVNHKLNVMETAEPVTRELLRQLTQHNLLSENTQQGEQQFFSSLFSTELENTFSQLWQQKVTIQTF